MQVEIKITRQEFESGLALGQEAATIAFAKSLGLKAGALGNTAKAKYLLGLQVAVSRTFTHADIDITVAAILHRTKGVHLSLDVDMIAFHNLMRVVYANPEMFKEKIVKQVATKKGRRLTKSLLNDTKFLVRSIEQLQETVRSYRGPKVVFKHEFEKYMNSMSRCNDNRSMYLANTYIKFAKKPTMASVLEYVSDNYDDSEV